MSKAKSAEDIRKDLLNHFKMLSKYWANLPNKTIQERCDGVVFTILSTFDGSSIDFPSFDISCSPNETDKDYCKEQGRDWFKDGMVINNTMLHEDWCDNE